MEPITTGMQGAAVEDVQSRLLQLGYTIDGAEVVDKRFGTTTEQAVSTFRLDSGLAAGHAVDISCWSALVDASYKLGDRTLYLRMPNFHGADVQALQRALNVLGFACGEDDGYFGPHTEAALQQFQENVGLFADGMAFQDTYATSTACIMCGRASPRSPKPSPASVLLAPPTCSSASRSPLSVRTPSHAALLRACGTSPRQRPTTAA